MTLKDYLEFIEPLRLPCGGKTYTLPPVGVRDGIVLVEGLDPRSESTVTDEDLARILLGDTLEEMQADNVPAGFIAKAVLTALAEFRNGRDAAEEFWEAVADPKALMDLLSRQQAEQESTPSTRTGAAPKTRSRASGTGTTSSRPSSTPSKAKTAATRSDGSTSSSSGPSSKGPSRRRSASTSPTGGPTGPGGGSE